MEPVIICRCEDITLKEVEKAIDMGYDNFEELKRYLRVGMGPCQGRTCIPLIRGILARKHGLPVEDVDVPTNRPPNSLLSFGSILKEVDNG